jgi:hypothetical protein
MNLIVIMQKKVCNSLLFEMRLFWPYFMVNYYDDVPCREAYTGCNSCNMIGPIGCCARMMQYGIILAPPGNGIASTGRAVTSAGT